MPNFNKKLAQLEAIYDINNHNQTNIDGGIIESYIKTIFENASQYGIDDISKDWFESYKKKNPIKASTFIHNVLKESGTIVSKQSIFESITVEGI